MLLFASAPAFTAPPQRSTEGPWLKGRVLVMPKPGLSHEAVGKLAKGEGGKSRRLNGSNMYVLELPAQASEKAVLARLRAHRHLEFAELDVLLPIDSSNDPYAGSQWHLTKIGADSAWATTAGAGVVLAILDSGVEPDHPDLKDRLIPGYNFYEGNTSTADVYGHGTKVAGAAAATLNNGLGVASVAGAAMIMPIRVTGSDGYASLSALASGITFAADRGARVANLSFAASGYASIRSAAQYMKDKGGLVFVSAGNSGKDPGETTTTSLVVVSATDSNDAKTSWSNFGNHVHLAAPGAGIYSTAKGKTYASVSGTSFSSPITAATAALVMAANPSLTSGEVQDILYSTAVDLGAAGKDPSFGHGRVDAAAAVAAALGSSVEPPPDTQAPAVAIDSPAGGATLSGLATVDVCASDNVGVARVELRVNGGLIATDTTAPYSFSWDTSQLVDGMANLSAQACDSAGNCRESAAVAVNTANATTPPPPPADTTAPVVAITGLADGAVFAAGIYRIGGTASDDSGVEGLSMSFTVNGKRLRTSSGKGTVSTNWDTRKLAPGLYTLKLSATDAAGNTGSASITVTRQ
jgi:subtilisin family serine protease